MSESEQPLRTIAVTVTNTTEVMPRLPTLESVRRSADQESAAAIVLVTFRDAGPGDSSYPATLMDADAPQVFSHDVLTCVFCNEPADDERFRCELCVRPVWQPAVEMQYVCHIDCLRKAAHHSRRIGV